MLRWISVSFVNYFSFLLIFLSIAYLKTEVQRILKRRFKLTIFLAGVLVPFMLIWNIYGNFMIRSDYFTDYADYSYPLPSNTSHHNSSDSEDPSINLFSTPDLNSTIS